MTLQYPLPGLPLSLMLMLDGRLAWVRTAQFDVIFDQATSEDGVDAVFTMDGFAIGNVEFEYNVLYNYKEIPEMLQWLVAQNLPHPDATNSFVIGV